MSCQSDDEFMTEAVTSVGRKLTRLIGQPQPVWLPEDNTEGAKVLQALLESERALQ
jgi:hypothetical protein